MKRFIIDAAITAVIALGICALAMDADAKGRGRKNRAVTTEVTTTTLSEQDKDLADCLTWCNTEPRPVPGGCLWNLCVLDKYGFATCAGYSSSSDCPD